MTPIKNSCWENYLKTFTTSKQHVFGDKTVTVYRVEISTRTIDRAIDIVYIYSKIQIKQSRNGGETIQNVLNEQAAQTKNYKVT